MKNTLKNIIFSIAIISAPLATFAASEDAFKNASVDLPTYTVEGISALPLPKQSQIRSIPSVKAGTEIKLKFTVNKRGIPVKVESLRPVRSYPSAEVRDFVSHMRKSVSKWKFDPALDNDGNPIAVRIIMPVRVVEKENQTTALASIILDDSSHRL